MIGRVFSDMRAALMLLTRLPVWGAQTGAAPDLSRSVWAYPIVGVIVGSLGAAAYAVSAMFGVPMLLSAIIGIVAMILATGAFHEDGLADTADGLGGGATLEKKLEIMRDSRIGTYGTVAVALSLLIRVAALSSLSSVPIAAAALVSIACLSRGSIVALLATLDPARRDGMGAIAGGPGKPVVVVGGVFALAPLLFWPTMVGAAILAAAAFGALCVWYLGRRHIGGYTGDLLGAAQQVSECACWITLAALFS